MAEESLKKQTKKGLYWQFLNQFSNYGIQFIIGIFMARLLSPSDYGITALPAVFMAVAGIFAGAGFGTAMVRKPELTEEDLATSFYYSTGVGIICYIVLFFASPWIADFYNAPVLKPLMRVTALGFIYGPLGAPQGIILTRRLDFKCCGNHHGILWLWRMGFDHLRHVCWYSWTFPQLVCGTMVP